METIALCDLTHRSVGVCSEMIPYPLGCIKSYFHEFSSVPADVQLFKYAEDFAAAFFKHRPAIVGFSNYMWNLDLGLTMAREVKRVAPETLIVFGGPNYPLEVHRQQAWLKDHPMVDIYLVGEGEQPFTEVAELFFKNRSIDEVKRSSIYGLHALVDGKLHKNARTRSDGFDDSPRIADLNRTPSPYLKGYLDEFLKDPALVPLMECNRGCPFTCTFCVDGIGARSKVNKVSVARLEQELTYIAQRHNGKYLFIADTNFGMYPEDVEFCKIMAGIKDRYHYPLYLQVSTGKNQKARAIECAELLKGSLRFSAAVQSLDEEVLANIKRSNISYEQLIDAASQVAKIDGNTYSDVILALPGDSKTRHMNTVCRLIDGGLQQIRNHTLVILDGSELGTDAHRTKFKLKTRYRVIPRAFGIYKFGDQEVRSAEIEEVCVESETLSFDDYVECRRFALTTILFHNDSIFNELYQLLDLSGLKVSEWLRHLHAQASTFPRKLLGIYEKFTDETIHELTLTQEDLQHSIRTEVGVVEGYIDGTRGNNVLYGNQTRAYMTCMDEVTAIAYLATGEFLRANGAFDRLCPGYLSELERYAQMRKRKILEMETTFMEDFQFDFAELEHQRFTSLPAGPKPTTVEFYYDDWQKEFFADQMRRYGHDAQAWTKMFSRTPIKKMFRQARHAPVMASLSA